MEILWWEWREHIVRLSVFVCAYFSLSIPLQQALEHKAGAWRRKSDLALRSVLTTPSCGRHCYSPCDRGWESPFARMELKVHIGRVTKPQDLTPGLTNFRTMFFCNKYLSSNMERFWNVENNATPVYILKKIQFPDDITRDLVLFHDSVTFPSKISRKHT